MFGVLCSSLRSMEKATDSTLFIDIKLPTSLNKEDKKELIKERGLGRGESELRKLNGEGIWGVRRDV